MLEWKLIRENIGREGGEEVDLVEEWQVLILDKKNYKSYKIQLKCIIAELVSKSIIREEVRAKDMIIKSN